MPALRPGGRVRVDHRGPHASVATRNDRQMTDEASMDPSRRQGSFLSTTYTQQSLRVVEAMADALRSSTSSGWRRRKCGGRPGEIRIPDEVREGDYDLICVGSPTWFSGRACRSARS
jgi:hypothetical protein